MKWKANVILRKQQNVVFNEVDLCTFSYQPKYSRKQITDLDVLGISCDPDLYFRYHVAECKSVAEKAMEYLLKLQGTMHFFTAQKAYFIQKRIDINAREVGKDMGIYCLDESNIDYLLKSLGVSDPQFQNVEQDLYAARKRLLAEASEFNIKAANYFRYDFWTLPDHRNVLNLIRLIDSCSGKAGGKSENGRRFIVHQLTLLLLLAILRLCATLLRMNCEEIVEGTKTLIMGGSRERRDREALYDQVSIMIKDTTLQPYPGFLNDLTELANRYLSSLAFSCHSLRCFDFMSNCLLNEKMQDVWGKPNEVFDEKTIKFARDIIYFVSAQTKLDREIYGGIINNF